MTFNFLLLAFPYSIHSIQHSRFARQDGWELDDISLCLSGNIAVSGHNYKTDRTFVCIYSTVDNSDSRDKPTLLYEKEFKKYSGYWPSWIRPYVSFMKLNSTEILVTCHYDIVTIIDYQRDLVLRSRKVNGRTMCLSVSESQIFIGLLGSSIVNIYDNDLNEIKSIRLKGIRGRDWPRDIPAAADRLYVCTALYGRAFAASQDSSSTLRVYNKGRHGTRAYSITVSAHLGVVAILLDQNQIVFHNLSEKKSFLTLDVEYGVSRIRISDQGRIVTGNGSAGEVKIYDLASLFTFTKLKEALVSMLGRLDCEKLINFFALAENELDAIMNSDTPARSLLLALEERGVIHLSNVDRLEEAFIGLKMGRSFSHIVNVYQKTRDQTTSYDRFLATLSPHLTSSVLSDLCGYFNISDEKKSSITSSQNPGLSLLLTLHEMDVIKPSEVGALEQPFTKFRLVQAVAKIDEYRLILEEETRQLQTANYQTLEDKRVLFLECLKKKMKSWYETMTPVPWKKSCQWKSTDLFVGSGLILTDSKAKRNVQNIDEQCKLKHLEIFSHEKVRSETRIILEGDPGAGKTMLSSQLAYDWSQGKIDDVDILIFLPLKLVEDKTFVRAIKEFYIPTNMPIFENDIEDILASETEKICLLLDGLEEYSTGGRMREKESSEVMQVMRKEKHSNCKVVITSRSDFAHDLPRCPLLRIGRFGEIERNSYIEKLSPDDIGKQQKIKTVIQDNPFILDLCSVPLLFVLAVHNIESMGLSDENQFDKVAPFLRSMILTLCSSTTVKNEIDGIPSDNLGSEKMTLGELAFNGLCKGHQQLSWQKEFLESNIGSLKPWVDSGILILEEGTVTPEKDQDFFEMSKEEERKEKKKKKKKEKRKGTPEQEGKDGRQMESSAAGSSPKPPKKKKKKKEENEEGIRPSETDEMAAAEFPSTSHDMSQLPVLSDDIITTSLSSPSTSDDVSEIKESDENVSEPDSDPHGSRRKAVPRTADQVPLEVKFLHKVIQEWFAATFFCSMMRSCTSADQFQKDVFSRLHYISPTDLHYILRFTCYLYPPSCHLIIDYLLRSYRKDGHVPPYIMNCVFLCFNEHNDVKGSDMRNIVTDVCKEVITIQSEDSRLLQQAKSSLLEYASNDGVIIEKLELKDVIFAVDKTTLTLNSGVKLGLLHTLKKIEVSRWDQVLLENDYENILKLLSESTLLKEICCNFPSQPPEFLDEVTLGNVISKDLKVEWNIGHFVQSLDPRKGKWMMNFKQPGASTTQTTQVSGDKDSLESKEQKQQPTTSSSTGTDSSKPVHTEETQKQTERDSITENAVPEKKVKVCSQLVPEEPTKSGVMQRVFQPGTALSVSEERDVWEEAPVRSVEELAVQEEVPASGFDQRVLLEETPVAGFPQLLEQEETVASGDEGRSILGQTPTSGVTQRVFQEVSAVSSVGQRLFFGETAFSVAQRLIYEDPFVGDTAHTVVPEYLPMYGFVQNHVRAPPYQFLLQEQSVITQFGGVIEIPNTSVFLRVPPNALPEGMMHCLIQMRIIPISVCGDNALSFSANSSVRVELLPNHFQFRCHVELTLPHCLELRKNVLRRARIFMSHHNGGETPQWEEQIEQFYQLLDTTCIIWLKSFCWIKCEIDDEIVDAKRLKIYTAARKMYLDDMFAVVEVGYHLDMPGEQEILKINPDLILADRKPFVFLREGKHSLFVHFRRTVPQQWKYYDQNPKEITFHNVAASNEQTCQFLVEKQTLDQDIPMCFFIASQRHRAVERTVELMIRPEVKDQPKGTEQQQKRKIHTDHMTMTLQNLSKELGSEWMDVGRNLGMKDVLMSHIQADYPNSRREVIYGVLLHWKHTRGSEATYYRLIEALKQSGRSDLAQNV